MILTMVSAYECQTVRVSEYRGLVSIAVYHHQTGCCMKNADMADQRMSMTDTQPETGAEAVTPARLQQTACSTAHESVSVTVSVHLFPSQILIIRAASTHTEDKCT